MQRKITLGKFLYRDSFIHELDPRTKLLATLVLVISLFIVTDPWIYLMQAILLVVLFYVAKLSIINVFKGIKAIIILLVLTLFFRLIATPGQPIIDLGIMTPTYEGLLAGIKLVARITLMIVATSLLAYTTTPRRMAIGLEKAFSFLKVFKIPVNDFSVVTMIALRFIPVLIQEVGNTIDAKVSRGSKIIDGNVVERMRATFSVLVPVFVGIVEKSADLAMAMESRGFDEKRENTQMYPLHYSKKDVTCIIAVAIYAIAIIWIKFV